MQRNRIFILVDLREKSLFVQISLVSYCLSVSSFFGRNVITLTSDVNLILNFVFLPIFPNQQKTQFSKNVSYDPVAFT